MRPFIALRYIEIIFYYALHEHLTKAEQMLFQIHAVKIVYPHSQYEILSFVACIFFLIYLYMKLIKC